MEKHSPFKSVGEKLSSIRREATSLPQEPEGTQALIIDIGSAEHVRFLLEHLYSKEPLLKEIAELTITDEKDIRDWIDWLSEGYDIERYTRMERTVSEWLYALDGVWIAYLMNEVKKNDTDPQTGACAFKENPLSMMTQESITDGVRIWREKETPLREFGRLQAEITARSAQIELLLHTTALLTDRLAAILEPIVSNPNHHAFPLRTLTEKLAKLHSRRGDMTTYTHIASGIGTATNMLYGSMFVIPAVLHKPFPPSRGDVEEVLSLYRNSIGEYHRLARQPLNRFILLQTALEKGQWNPSYFSIDAHDLEKPSLKLNEGAPLFKQQVEIAYQESMDTLLHEWRMERFTIDAVMEHYQETVSRLDDMLPSLSSEERKGEFESMLKDFRAELAALQKQRQFYEELYTDRYGQTAHSLTQTDARFCPALHTNHIRFFMEMLEATARKYYWELVTEGEEG